MCVSAKFSPARVTRSASPRGPAAGVRQLGELEHLGAAELGHLDRRIGARRATPRPAGAAVTACSKVRAHAHHRRRIDRLRHRQDAVRRARADARRRRRAFRAGRLVLRRGARRRPGRRRLRRGASSTCCAHRGVDVVRRRARRGGKTFFWRGEYGWDLNSRETLDTQLGVFEGFQPKLSERSRASDVLFLANIQPDLQREVRAQLPRRALRRARLDEPVDRHRARLARAARSPSVDCVILNDAELRQLTGKPSLVSRPRARFSRGAPAATTPRGPRVIVAKQGEYGAALVTARASSRCPRIPLETVVDPDRRRRHVRRRASSATSPPTPTRSSPTSCCAGRWRTRPRSRRSTSRSSAPSASSA